MFVIKRPNSQGISNGNVFRFAIVALVAISFLVHKSTLFAQQPSESHRVGKVRGIEHAQRQLALRLVKPAIGEDKNFVCSPHDLYLTLALLTLAAEGLSQQELLDALSTKSVEQLRQDLIEHDQIGLPSRFALGALVKPAAHNGGLIINSQPDPESALGKAGYQEGDLLTHANGVPLRSFQQLGQILSLTCGTVNLTAIKSANSETISTDLQLDIHRQLVPVVQKTFVSSRVLLTSPRIAPMDDFVAKAKQLAPMLWVANALTKKEHWRRSVMNYVQKSSGDRVDPASILSTIPTADEDMIDFVIATSSNYQETWQRPFFKKHDKEPFYTPAGPRDVQMMTRIGQFQYADLSDSQVIEIPLESCMNRVRIWLPKMGSDITHVLTQLSTSDESNDVANRLNRTSIQLTLPLFQLQNEVGGEELKHALNLNRIFSDQAELGGLSSDTMIGVIAQLATFDCREDGVRASSATRIVGVPKGGLPDSLELTLNRPFYFELIEASGVILYAGVVNSPVKESPKPMKHSPVEQNVPDAEEHIRPKDSDLPSGNADV